MKKEKTYKTIAFSLLGLLMTLIIHLIITRERGYSAIGGEFLLIPLLLIINQIVIAAKERLKETNRHFERKESAVKYKNAFNENVKEGAK